MLCTGLKCSLAVGTLALRTAFVVAQDTTKPHTKPAHTTTPPKTETAPPTELPPGFTPEMMQTMQEAATPGPMQTWLCEDAGSWAGNCKMWMAPGTEPTISGSTMTNTPILGGRFVRQDVTGDMGEWGQFEGTGMVGFDKGAGQFQSAWADNMGTAMMYGTGSVSSDQKVLTINYTYFCPIAKKEVPFKQTITRNADGTRTMRMWGVAAGAPTGEMFQLMETVYKRTHSHAEHADAEHTSTTKSHN